MSRPSIATVEIKMDMKDPDILPVIFMNSQLLVAVEIKTAMTGQILCRGFLMLRRYIVAGGTRMGIPGMAIFMGHSITRLPTAPAGRMTDIAVLK
jgi:hypothetical protein